MSGCSKDDDGDSTGPSDNPEDFTYLLNVYSLAKGSYEMMLMPISSQDAIENVECTINGNSVSFSWNEMYLQWTGTHQMSAGGTYNFVLSIDGDEYDTDLTLVNQLTNVSWPIIYQPSEENEVTWELAGDNEFQLLQGTTETSVIEIEYLDSSDRSFTIPAEWIGTSSQMYQFTLTQTNEATSDDLMIISTDFANEIYLLGN